jgi:hypothetical protein
MHVVNSAPRSGLWHREAETWLSTFDPPEARETLLATDRITADECEGADVGTLLVLDEERALQDWLLAWARQAAVRPVRVPLVRPEPKPISDSTRLTIAGVIGACVLVMCLLHGWWVNTAKEHVGGQVVAARQPAAELKKIQKQANALEKQLETLRKRTATIQVDVDRCRRALGSQRQRVARILTGLSQSGQNDYVIQAIDSGRDGLHVRGVCRRPEQANALAKTMARRLQSLGLRVHLPEKEVQYALSGRRAYLFDLLIQDVADFSDASARADTAGSSQPLDAGHDSTEPTSGTDQPQA